MAIDENTGLDDSTKPLNKNLPRRDISKINITTSKTPISKTYVDDKNLDIDAYEEERKKGVGFTLTPDSYVQAQPRLEELQKQKEIRLNDYLAYNQGLGEKIGNGLVKFGGRVYTSVVGSTIGSLYGLYSWARDGEFKSFYDNEFQKSLDGINDYLAEEYKHYYTSSKDDWEIGNFVFDKVFDGLGFATGAILSSYIGGSVTGALMKSFRLTNAVKLNTVNKLLNATDEIKNLDRFNKLTSSLNKINRTDQLLKLPQTTSSLVTGAVYESGVEARHAYNETKELLIDMYKQTHEGKAPTGSDLEEINKLSGETANGIFAANMALVGGGNILQFGKHMGLDFDDLRKMFKPTIAKEIVDETGKKAFISTGSKFVRGTRAVVKNAVIESQEEMLQSVITGTGKDYVANKYRDPEKDELGDLLNSSIKSFKKVYSSEEGWEEGFIGAIVGSAGVVAPRSRTKEDGTKQFPVTLAGGIIESVSDWRKSERKRDELISNLNSKGSIESLKAGVSHHIRESRNEKIKDNAIESNNALAFKNAQDDQFHSFVTSRIEAGMESTIQRDLNTLKEAPLEDFKRSMNIESSEYTEADRNKAIASFERRADMIIGSTKFIDKIYRGDNPQVREALIYNQSMANRIEERKNTISNEINELTGGNSIALNTFKENGERLSKSEIFKAVPKEHQFKKAEYEKLYEDYISLSDRQNKMYDELYALLDNKGESEAEKKIKEAEQEAVKRSTAKKKEEENIKKAKEGAEKANTIKAQKDAEDKKAKDIDNLNKTSSSLKEDLEEDNPNEIKMSSEDQLKMIKNIWEKSSIEDLTKFFEQTGESINNFPKPIREAFLKKKAALLEEKEKIDARNRDPKNTTGNIKKDKVVEATVESAINSDKSINEPPTDATKIKDNETELQKINQGSKVTIVDNKEIRENGTGIFSIEGLIIDAHNSVANSTITFIEDENGIKRLGQLNPNTNTDVLSSKLLQEGENITIELYTEPTFQTYNSEGIASEVIENKIGTTDQIMVVKDSKGRIFGYIHDIDYIKENRVYPTYQDKDNLKRNRDLLNQFRTKIFNHIQSTGLPYSSKIAGKSSGSIMEAVTPKKYTTKLSDAILEDKRVKVLVVRDGGFYENGKRITKEEIDSDFQQSFSDTFFNKKEDGGYAGSTMIAVPSANGRYLLEFARNPKLLEEPHIAKEINTLLEAFVNKDFETLNTILNSKYDESSYETLELRNDVTDFISNFMYLNADINSPYRISLMKDGTIIFADVNGVMTVLQPNTEVFTTNLTKLKERVNNSYFAVNLIKGASNPWINFKNKEGVIEKIKYNDLVKNHLRVNFQGHQVTTSKGNEVVYTANPIISIQSEGSAQLGEIPTTKTKPTDTEGLFTKEEFDQAKQTTSTESDIEAKKADIERRNIQMQPDNIKKILDGTKTTTTRSESQAKQINIPIGKSAIVNFGGQDFRVTNRGLFTIDEAGGKEAIEKSENFENNTPKYQQTKDWLKGKGKLYVYDIAKYDVEQKSKSEVSEQPVNIKNNRLNKLKPKSKGYTSLEEAGSKNKEDKVKTVDDIIKENVTSEEIDKIAEEEKIPVENVKEAVKKEVISQMNEKKPTRKTSLLKKVANRIKKLLLSILIVTTFVNGFSFNYAPNEKSLAYDNVKVENLESFEEVYLEQEEMNKKDNLNTITDFYSETDEVYLVVDKQAAMSHLFQGDSLITSYEVGTGKVKGDSQTKTVVKDGKVLWDQGNMQTGAGIYTVGNEGQYKHSPAYTLINENGIEVSSALHETLDSRKKFFNNNNIKDNRMSYGCINFQSNSLKDLGNREEFKSGSKVFILPDSHTNEFRVIDGELKFISDDNTVNRSLIKYEYNPIEIKADNVNEDGKQFLMNLSENKEKLMGLYPTVSNDVYNTIVTIAYGIFGQESSFGTYGGVRGKYGYFKDQLANAFTDKDISIGVTQIRLSSVNQKTRDTFNIRTTNDLNNIDNSAIATMSLLLDIYENQIPNKMKSSYKELLPLAYSNRTEFNKAINGDTSALNNKYVQNVLKYAEDVTVYMGSGVKSEDVTNKNKKGLTKEEWKLLSTEERKSFNWQQKNCK